MLIEKSDPILPLCQIDLTKVKDRLPAPSRGKKWDDEFEMTLDARLRPKHTLRERRLGGMLHLVDDRTMGLSVHRLLYVFLHDV